MHFETFSLRKYLGQYTDTGNKEKHTELRCVNLPSCYLFLAQCFLQLPRDNPEVPSLTNLRKELFPVESRRLKPFL